MNKQSKNMAAAVSKWFFAAVAISFSTHSLADAIAQLKDFSANSKTAKGEFVQRMQKNSAGAMETSSGSFAFSRPGKFRWEVRNRLSNLWLPTVKSCSFSIKT
jgi:outer membrane lipoprotein-sorting protein